VASGDTLWSIALHAEPTGDTRAVIERIKELNGLADDLIIPGVVLKVPTHGH